MNTITRNIDFRALDAEIKEQKNSGYEVCVSKDASLKVIFKDSLIKKQKTFYFKAG